MALVVELHCSSVSWFESPDEPFVTLSNAAVIHSRTSMINFMLRHSLF
jgi:hypothetical protein